jgi:hypothetical protein
MRFYELEKSEIRTVRNLDLPLKSHRRARRVRRHHPNEPDTATTHRPSRGARLIWVILLGAAAKPSARILRLRPGTGPTRQLHAIDRHLIHHLPCQKLGQIYDIITGAAFFAREPKGLLRPVQLDLAIDDDRKLIAL